MQQLVECRRLDPRDRLFAGDEPFAGGEGRDQLIELGSGRLIPGFEEQLTGASAGDLILVAMEEGGLPRALPRAINAPDPHGLVPARGGDAPARSAQAPRGPAG